jgi:hypothetical protein
VRKQRIALKHHTEIALFRRDIGDRFAIHLDVAGRDVEKPGDHHQQRRFPRSGRAKQR